MGQNVTDVIVIVDNTTKKVAHSCKQSRSNIKPVWPLLPLLGIQGFRVFRLSRFYIQSHDLTHGNRCKSGP